MGYGHHAVVVRFVPKSYPDLPAALLSREGGTAYWDELMDSVFTYGFHGKASERVS